MNRQ
jgi:hypothetical protein